MDDLETAFPSQVGALVGEETIGEDSRTIQNDWDVGETEETVETDQFVGWGGWFSCMDKEENWEVQEEYENGTNETEVVKNVSFTVRVSEEV